MRITDNRYRGELDKFDLAVRLIHHEARTGTIRRFTGFTEDRIRKLYGAYFKTVAGEQVRRRRGKSPRQIARFVNSTRRHTEATACATLLKPISDCAQARSSRSSGPGISTTPSSKHGSCIFLGAIPATVPTFRTPMRLTTDAARYASRRR